MTNRTRARVLAAAFVLITAGLLVAFVPPHGPRSIDRFDADCTATLELAMWQAYYDRHNLELFRLLTVQLREQYHYSRSRALRAGFHLARAAATFANLRNQYDQVLPDLQRGFDLARTWTRADFDPRHTAICTQRFIPDPHTRRGPSRPAPLPEPSGHFRFLRSSV